MMNDIEGYRDNRDVISLFSGAMGLDVHDMEDLGETYVGYDDEIKQLGGNVYSIPFITRVGPFAYAKSLRHA